MIREPSFTAYDAFDNPDLVTGVTVVEVHYAAAEAVRALRDLVIAGAEDFDADFDLYTSPTGSVHGGCCEIATDPSSQQRGLAYDLVAAIPGLYANYKTFIPIRLSTSDTTWESQKLGTGQVCTVPELAAALQQVEVEKQAMAKAMKKFRRAVAKAEKDLKRVAQNLP